MHGVQSPIRRTIITSTVLLCAVVFADSARAAIIAASVTAGADAAIRTATDSESSNQIVDSLMAFATLNNSYTDSSLAYSFDINSGLLTANSTVTTEKTEPSQRGGDHLGSSSMVLSFEVDADTDFTMSGSWGFFDADLVPPDSLTYELTGSSGTIFASTTTSNTGIGSVGFNEAGTLSAGTYQLTFQNSLAERFDTQGFAQAGWTLQSFQLTSPTAIPEPCSVVFMAFLAMVFSTRRRRRTRVSA